MTYGPKLKELLALRDAGREVPVLDKRPDIPATLDWVWNAYADFTKSRLWIMGAPQAVTIAEIVAYSHVMDYSREEVQELVFFVRLLDTAYFEDLAAKAKLKKGGNTDAGARGTNRRKRR